MLNTRYTRFAQDLIRQIHLAEAQEKKQVVSSFQGKTILAIASENLGKKGIALLTMPVGSEQVLAAHISLDVFQKILSKDSMLSSFLVDQTGKVLVHADQNWIGLQGNSVELFDEMKKSKIFAGQSTYSDNQGNRMLGGFQKLGVGSVGVLATISESEATSSLRSMRNQLLIFLSAAFFTLFFLGYAIAQKFNVKPILSKSGGAIWKIVEIAGLAKSQSTPGTNVPPGKYVVTVVHGSLRQTEKLLESLSPEEGIEMVNEFFDIASSVITHRGGIFEKQSGTSFVGFFGLLPESSGGDFHSRQALRAVFDFRYGLVHLNKSRVLEGRKPVFSSIGVETGSILAGRMGGEVKAVSVIGDTVRCAEALDRLTLDHNTDALVSHDVWSKVENEFVCETVGEATLTRVSGLRSFGLLKGFRDLAKGVNGQEVPVQSVTGELVPSENEKAEILENRTVVFTAPKEEKPKRWSVNNGSQIVGPLGPEEIAALLFTQELDFDCECWAEGTGKSALIRSAGIFLGSEDQDAQLWAYDGKTIQGPFSPGFLKTALMHGALPLTVLVCDTSTINGWKKLEEFPSLSISKESSDPAPEASPPKKVA
ncbi:MAG: hypothetical protein HYX41_03580 [Bdellovibrio sp.]|nr:hypothetical protein [Bdellovibrio sp.]